MSRKTIAAWLLCQAWFALTASAQDQPAAKESARFSHTGLKAFVGTTSFEMIAERGLKAGEGGSLGLGYGFTERFSLWLNLFGSKHAPEESEEATFEFSGLELTLQQKFETNAPFQPYGKLGFGIYGLDDTTSPEALVGAGLSVGLGVDFFFSRHLGIGAEVVYKKLDYFQRSLTTPEGELLTNLSPLLNGDTVGFMLTFTVQ